jgi:hypothetical protein
MAGVITIAGGVFPFVDDKDFPSQDVGRALGHDTASRPCPTD